MRKRSMEVMKTAGSAEMFQWRTVVCTHGWKQQGVFSFPFLTFSGFFRCDVTVGGA